MTWETNSWLIFPSYMNKYLNHPKTTVNFFFFFYYVNWILKEIWKLRTTLKEKLFSNSKLCVKWVFLFSTYNFLIGKSSLYSYMKWFLVRWVNNAKCYYVSRTTLNLQKLLQESWIYSDWTKEEDTDCLGEKTIYWSFSEKFDSFVSLYISHFIFNWLLSMLNTYFLRKMHVSFNYSSKFGC